VTTLSAGVLEAVDKGRRHVVRVRFTDLLREAAEQAHVPLDEAGTSPNRPAVRAAG
jgi:hypothetical protein